MANAIVRDERQPGGVARDSATAALDAAAIHAEAMTAPHAAAPAPPAVVTIAAPVGQPGFAEEVAGKLVHVVLRQDRAELRLNPAELGPVQIRIDVDGSSTQLTIVATQPATREALEHALPHLRELLAAHGIALGQASVHDGRAQDRTPAAPWAPADAGDQARGAQPAPVLAQGRIGLSDRLIDTFV